jgi:methylmalonyl-CoA/ethylmalonyl-CoA epimerase
MAEVTELRIALTVPDFEQAVAFYREALGMEQVAEWTSSDGKVVVLSGGRATLELLDAAQAEYVDRVEVGRRISGPVRLAVEVSDTEATARRLVAAGAEEVAPAVTTPWGDRNARISAPDGLQLTLFSAES